MPKKQPTYEELVASIRRHMTTAPLGCIRWTGPTRDNRFPMLDLNYMRNQQARRYIYAVHVYGKWPHEVPELSGLRVVLKPGHIGDRLCVNPNHLVADDVDSLRAARKEVKGTLTEDATTGDTRAVTWWDKPRIGSFGETRAAWATRMLASDDAFQLRQVAKYQQEHGPIPETFEQRIEGKPHTDERTDEYAGRYNDQDQPLDEDGNPY